MIKEQLEILERYKDQLWDHEYDRVVALIEQGGFDDEIYTVTDWLKERFNVEID